MTRHRKPPYLEILAVSKDSKSAAIKLKATLIDGEVVIRWGLDDFTYRQLKNAVSTRYFDSMPGLNYKYMFLLGYGCERKPEIKTDLLSQIKRFLTRTKTPRRKCWASVECILDDKRKDIEFDCSELFASNMEWFSKIKSVDELKNIEWLEDNG